MNPPTTSTDSQFNVLYLTTASPNVLMHQVRKHRALILQRSANSELRFVNFGGNFKCLSCEYDSTNDMDFSIHLMVHIHRKDTVRGEVPCPVCTKREYLSCSKALQMMHLLHKHDSGQNIHGMASPHMIVITPYSLQPTVVSNPASNKSVEAEPPPVTPSQTLSTKSSSRLAIEMQHSHLLTTAGLTKTVQSSSGPSPCPPSIHNARDSSDKRNDYTASARPIERDSVPHVSEPLNQPSACTESEGQSPTSEEVKLQYIDGKFVCCGDSYSCRQSLYMHIWEHYHPSGEDCAHICPDSVSNTCYRMLFTMTLFDKYKQAYDSGSSVKDIQHQIENLATVPSFPSVTDMTSSSVDEEHGWQSDFPQEENMVSTNNDGVPVGHFDSCAMLSLPNNSSESAVRFADLHSAPQELLRAGPATLPEHASSVYIDIASTSAPESIDIASPSTPEYIDLTSPSSPENNDIASPSVLDANCGASSAQEFSNIALQSLPECNDVKFPSALEYNDVSPPSTPNEAAAVAVYDCSSLKLSSVISYQDKTCVAQRSVPYVAAGGSERALRVLGESMLGIAAQCLLPHPPSKIGHLYTNKGRSNRCLSDLGCSTILLHNLTYHQQHQKLPCPECVVKDAAAPTLTFDSPHDLEAHQLTAHCHPGDGLYACPNAACSFTSNSTPALKGHIESSACVPEGQFIQDIICKACNTSFSDWPQLEQHFMDHSCVWVKCAACCVSAPLVDVIRSHSSSHKNECTCATTFLDDAFLSCRMFAYPKHCTATFICMCSFTSCDIQAYQDHIKSCMAYPAEKAVRVVIDSDEEDVPYPENNITFSHETELQVTKEMHTEDVHVKIKDMNQEDEMLVRATVRMLEEEKNVKEEIKEEVFAVFDSQLTEDEVKSKQKGGNNYTEEVHPNMREVQPAVVAERVKRKKEVVLAVFDGQLTEDEVKMIESGWPHSKKDVSMKTVEGKKVVDKEHFKKVEQKISEMYRRQTKEIEVLRTCGEQMSARQEQMRALHVEVSDSLSIVNEQLHAVDDDVEIAETMDTAVSKLMAQSRSKSGRAGPLSWREKKDEKYRYSLRTRLPSLYYAPPPSDDEYDSEYSVEQSEGVSGSSVLCQRAPSPLCVELVQQPDREIPADSVNAITCDICKRKFKNLSGQQRHMLTHKGVKEHECKVCKQKFGWLCHLRTHEQKHVKMPSKQRRELKDKTPHRCPHSGCEKAFSQRDRLKRHLKSHEAATLNRLADGVCAPSTMRKRGWPKGKPRKGKKKRQVSNNKTVQPEHPSKEEVKTYECKICHKSFTSSWFLNQHNRIHSGMKPYVCDLCRRRFTQLSQLQQHKRTHTGVKPHDCETCQKSFTQLSHLQQHRRTHTGEAPYKCQQPGCDMAFKQLSNLQGHMRAEHAVQKTYRCSFCDKIYPDEKSLHIHNPMLCALGDGKCVTCNKCDFMTSFHHLAGSHARLHDGDTGGMQPSLFTCPWCPFHCWEWEDFAAHIACHPLSSQYKERVRRVTCSEYDCSFSVVSTRTHTREMMLQHQTEVHGDEKDFVSRLLPPYSCSHGNHQTEAEYLRHLARDHEDGEVVTYIARLYSATLPEPNSCCEHGGTQEHPEPEDNDLAAADSQSVQASGDVTSMTEEWQIELDSGEDIPAIQSVMPVAAVMTSPCSIDTPNNKQSYAEVKKTKVPSSKSNKAIKNNTDFQRGKSRETVFVKGMNVASLKGHKCNQCNYLSKWKTNLMIHWKRCHIHKASLTMPVVGITATKKTDSGNLTTAKGEEIGGNSCEAVTRHMHEVHPEQIQKCRKVKINDANIATRASGATLYYSLKFEDDRAQMVYTCCYAACQSEFADEDSIKEHLAVAHLSYTPYTCTHCQRQLPSHFSLRKHHHEEHTDLELKYTATPPNKDKLRRLNALFLAACSGQGLDSTKLPVEQRPELPTDVAAKWTSRKRRLQTNSTRTSSLQFCSRHEDVSYAE